MKKLTQMTLFLACLTLCVITVQAQSTSTPSYKDMVEENPTAEADIQAVSSYVNSLIAGDTTKAKMLLTKNYKGYGPAPTDSVNSDQTIKGWKENYKVQSNRKVSFLTETFRVKMGNLKGNWVSVWGDYSFTQNGKDIKFPFQYTAHVTNGKIDADRIYFDRLYILQTLGFKVTPP